MLIDTISAFLSHEEVSALFRSLPLPKGTEITKVSLGENIFELTIKIPGSYRFPVKVKLEIQSFSGSVIWFAIKPPMGLDSSNTTRPLISAIPGTAYTGYNLMKIDLVEFSAGKLRGLDIERLDVDPGGLFIALAEVHINSGWKDLLGFL